MSECRALRGVALFHLNLCYSAIEESERPAVVDRCYWPLLGLCEGRPWLALAIEASGHTLELAEALDPAWVRALRALVEQGRVELVGSGDTQLAGPLVPAAVNRWNQRLGQETYARSLGRTARTALVNELCWSQGLVDAYLDAGYDSLCMEWNNPRQHHPEWDDAWRWRPARTAAPGGRAIVVHWVDSIAFQKLQRAATGDLDLDEYRSWLAARCRAASSAVERPHLFLYASDAEVFDHRPGRYSTEAPCNPRGEWRTLGECLDAAHELGIESATPAMLLADAGEADPLVRLSSCADPLPVKKQPKYNVTRWALSGRDDLGLNSRCFARARALAGVADPEAWRALCRAWGSDLRTHLTERRWAAARPARSADGERASDVAVLERPREAQVVREGRWIRVRTEGVELVLDAARGLSIRRLAFARCGAAPLLATLPHGYFDDIDWAADFYTGHAVVELPGRGRVTDLAPADVRVEHGQGGEIRIAGKVPTGLGPLEKEVRVGAAAVALRFGFSGWSERPMGSLRAGVLTLDPDTWGTDALAVVCANGGVPERFAVEGDFDHGAAVSALVTARTALGATEGELRLEGIGRTLVARWPQEQAAALPLLACRQVDGRRLVRVAFSLGELDDTFRPGAPLADFSLVLSSVESAA